MKRNKYSIYTLTELRRIRNNYPSTSKTYQNINSVISRRKQKKKVSFWDDYFR